jgi:carbonic anhydrase/acetyltransferase-like protein (isoleucine patch superfamily)
MLKVYSVDGITPVVDPSAYVHPSAVLIGDVIVGPGTWVRWPACVATSGASS